MQLGPRQIRGMGGLSVRAFLAACDSVVMFRPTTLATRRILRYAKAALKTCCMALMQKEGGLAAQSFVAA